MKYKAVFFDFDGTLMNTSEGVLEAGKKAMESIGLEPKFITSPLKFIGPPLNDCFKIAFGVKDPEKIEKLCTLYRKFYNEGSCLKSVFYPGILDVISRIRELGYKLAVTTLKHEELAVHMLKAFKVDDYFDGVYGLNIENDSTKAGLILDGCRALCLKPSEVVLVGDSCYDEEGAAQAGCDFIGVDWGFGFTKGQKGMISDPYRILELI